MKTSKKDLPGMGETEMKFNVGTFEEWVEKLGTEFIFADYVGHKIANNAASQIKAACKTAFDLEGKAKKDTVITAHKALVERVKAGETLNLLDFVNKPRAAKTSKEEEVCALILAKWEGSDKKAGFLQKLGLDPDLEAASAEEVKDAYMESLNAGIDL